MLANNRKSAFAKSIELLYKASTRKGFVASVQDHDNYKRVWTRDGVVCSIAALLSQDEKLIATAKKTIQTIFNHQHPTGFMPSNVSLKGKAVSYGGTVGRADNPLWAVIGLCLYALNTNDKSLAKKNANKVKKCFAVVDAWEFNGRHLIYVPQSGDWADEYIQHGYILFEQLLRIWALQLAAKVYQNEKWSVKAAQITEVVQNNYWQTSNHKNYYTPNLQHQLKDTQSKFWLMGFNPSRTYQYFDLQANALALLLQIGDSNQTNTLIKWLTDFYETNNGNLLPSFYPTIKNNDADMQELINNYAYQFRNEPNQFHNGGLWQVWNGWMAMALIQNNENNLAKKITNAIDKANEINNDFNECINAETLAPCGVSNCSWSAAGAIIAAASVQGKKIIIK